MQTIHDVDVLLLLATLLAAKRKPAELLEIVAADGGYALTPDAQTIVTRLPKKAETAERLFLIKDRLSEYTPKGQHPVVSVAEADINAAITAHRAAAATTAKNLLVPKPKPEPEKHRPGQRQRKPMPARKRKD